MTEKFKSKISINGSKEQVFDSITDYKRIDSYTDAIRIAGRGSGVGTRVYFNLQKDVLDIPTNYTVKIEFIEYNRPELIRWEIVGDINANGSIELVEDSDYTDIIFDFKLNIKETNVGALPAPNVADTSQILEYIYPRIYEQASLIIKGIVEDVEGQSRDVDVEIMDLSSMFSDAI